MGIESVVEERKGMNDAMCSACEMAVEWMESQLRQNETQQNILNYVNQVNT